MVSLTNKDYGRVSDLAPRTVMEAIERGQPISVVAKVTGIEPVYNQVEFELIKCMALLNLNLTIKEAQYPHLAKELVETFPNESIEDFQLCFKKGIRGTYGTIYNVDLAVLSRWMGEYLEEKYQLIESAPKQEELSEVDYEAFKKRIEEKRNQERERAEAQREEKKKLAQDIIEGKSGLAYTPLTEEQLKERELKRLWGLECHDLYTGKPNSNYIPFEQWKKQ